MHQNTDEALKKMNEFRSVVNKKNPKLRYLDFGEMTYINSSSALMLAAEIDVWNSKVSNKLLPRHQMVDNGILQKRRQKANGINI